MLSQFDTKDKDAKGVLPFASKKDYIVNIPNAPSTEVRRMRTMHIGAMYFIITLNSDLRLNGPDNSISSVRVLVLIT